jgi:hypothetical protein
MKNFINFALLFGLKTLKNMLFKCKAYIYTGHPGANHGGIKRRVGSVYQLLFYQEATLPPKFNIKRMQRPSRVLELDALPHPSETFKMREPP